MQLFLYRKKHTGMTDEEIGLDLWDEIKKAAELHGWPEEEFFEMVLEISCGFSLTRYPTHRDYKQAWKQAVKELRRRLYNHSAEKEAKLK